MLEMKPIGTPRPTHSQPYVPKLRQISFFFFGTSGGDGLAGKKTVPRHKTLPSSKVETSELSAEVTFSFLALLGFLLLVIDFVLFLQKRKKNILSQNLWIVWIFYTHFPVIYFLDNKFGGESVILASSPDFWSSGLSSLFSFMPNPVSVKRLQTQRDAESRCGERGGGRYSPPRPCSTYALTATCVCRKMINYLQPSSAR